MDMTIKGIDEDPNRGPGECCKYYFPSLRLEAIATRCKLFWGDLLPWAFDRWRPMEDAWKEPQDREAS